ncbi:MAG: type I pullulanase [Clostridiales bacterium]|nr:type I pullulanase [Clostridiales bacterium]
MFNIDNEMLNLDFGAIYAGDSTKFRLWSPTSDSISLSLFEDGNYGDAYEVHPMERLGNGIWEVDINGNLDGVYYTYLIRSGDCLHEVVDINARAVGANGMRGMVINLESTNPDGWHKQNKISLNHYTDAVIYEVHVRDFSIDDSGNFKFKGKFLAFTEKGRTNSTGDSIGLDSLLELGVTHVHLLPSYDFESIDELKPEKPDFNWGYDPQNYNAPEGSYSTNARCGHIRIRELKLLISTLHEHGIGVIMDMVYNHTYRAIDSNFNKTVPNYYYRFDGDKFSNGSGCGNEIASEREMVRKFIVDSAVFWAKEYKIDGIRFDLMGLMDITTLQDISKSIRKFNADFIIYGEGWTAGETPLKLESRGIKANAEKVPDIAFFNDNFRDAIKGSVFDSKDRGFTNGGGSASHLIKYGIAGAVPHHQLKESCGNSWAISPSQSVNYVEAHDNLTLWDKFAASNADCSHEDRVRMAKLSAAIIFLSQGIPFIQAGQEFLRSKGGDENSYQSSDEINSIKWNSKTKYYDVFSYYRGLIEFRKKHDMLRLSDKSEVEKHLYFEENLPDNVIGYTLIKDNKNHIKVYFNGGNSAAKVDLPIGKYNIYIDESQAGITPLQSVSGELTIPKISAIVITNF